MLRSFCLYCCFFALLTVFSCSNEEDSVSVPTLESSSPATGLFQDLDAAAAGIDFVNEVKSNLRLNHVNYAYLFNGAGVGIIDYDNDGLQDIYFVSNQDENRLYRNLGDFKFEDVTEATGTAGKGGFCVGVNIADVDGNGYQDIYLSRTGVEDTPEGREERENLLYLNNGDGTFSEKSAETGLNSNHPSIQAVFFDFDLDGDLDCYQLNTPIDFANVNSIRAVETPNGLQRKLGPNFDWESDQLFRNDNGVFTDISKQAGISNRAFALSALIIDFNKDNLPDIYVANDYLDDDYVYVNQGDGTFVDQSRRYLRHSSLNSMGSDLGDINNDGLEDFVSMDMLAEKQERRKSLESNMRPDRYNTLVRLGYSHQMMRNQLHLNNGLNFSDVGELAGIGATDWSWAPLLVDFDNDRNLDLFVSNGYRYDLTDLDFVSYTVDSIMNSGGISTKTFDDFSSFLKLIPSVPQPNYLFRNLGGLKFDNVAASWNVGEPSYSSSAVYADLDNDGDIDLLVGNHERLPFIHRNVAIESGTGGNYLQVIPQGYAKNTAGFGVKVVAEVGEERLAQTLQTATGFLGTNQNILHFGLGEADLVDQLTITWPDGKTQVLAGVKVNQRIKVTYSEATGTRFANQVSGADAGAMFTFPQGQRGLRFRHQENYFDDFDRQFLQPRMLSREGPALAKGDVDGDGLADLFIGGAKGKASAMYQQTTQGQFREFDGLPAADAAYEDVAALFFDADGDGDQDLYVASGGAAAAKDDPSYQDRLYLNEGGMFARAENALPPMYTSTGAVAVLDYDADGDLDLVVGGRGIPGSYPLAPRSYLLENNGGSFRDVTQVKFPALTNIGMVTAIATGNVLGDGHPEIVVAGEWMPLQTFAWDGEQYSLSLDGPQAGAGFWHSLLIEDLDGDGQQEIIAGNDGLNTRFQPGPNARVTLYADDFDNNGAIDPIVTFEDEFGRMVPVTTKAMMIKQIPKLKKKFVMAKDYAKASIEEIFPGGELAGATILDLATVASVVIRKSGDGWSIEELPRMAQVAPVRDIATADFNGDGLMDLLMVGNDYGLQVETGRVDAGNGTILLNDGQGGWTYSPNIKHGFWASLDARGLERIALADGTTGWVIVNNNGPAAIYAQE